MKYLKIIGSLFLVVICSLCNNNDYNYIQNLRGIYSETSPVAGRSQLNFIDGNTVVKSEPDNSIEDKFIYEIIGNMIKLTPVRDNSKTQEFEIQIRNNLKFEIENLYPSVGINQKTYMTFEK